MNRRDFLKLFGAGVAGAALVDPDFLKWEHGARTYFDMAAGRQPLWLNVGDIITIADRYAINPITHLPTLHLQEFIVTANVTDDATTVLLHPRIAFIASDPQRLQRAVKSRARYTPPPSFTKGQWRPHV